MPRKAFSSRSVVGRAVCRRGLPAYSPSNVSPAACSCSRTTYSTKVSTRKANESRRTIPRGAVQADRVCLQVGHRQSHSLRQAEAAAPKGFPSAPLPRLYLTHPVVSLGKNVGQPTDGQPTDTQPLAIAMRFDHRAQYLGNAHRLLLAYQQGYVVYPFCVDVYLCHSGRSLLQFRFSRKK